MMTTASEQPALKRKLSLSPQKTKIELKTVTPPWTPDETAQFLGVTVGTLQVWRCTKRYPLPYLKIGRKVMYDPEKVVAFKESCTVA